MAKIQIYTTPTCAYCKMSKEYFQSKGLEYEEFDVSTDAQKRQEMVEETGQMGVPVLKINGKTILGFDKTKIDDALAVEPEAEE